MKIKESELRKLIQESMQELAMEALAEEWDKEKDTKETDEPFEDNLEEAGWGISGGIGGAGPRASSGGMKVASAGAGGGLGKLGRQFQIMVAKAKAGDEMAKKNVMSIAKANPQNAEMQAAVAELEAPAKRAAQVKANPFTAMDTSKFVQTGAVQQEAKLRKMIATLIQEVKKEQQAKKKTK